MALITVNLDSSNLSKLLKKKYYQELIALLIASDEKLHRRYLPDTMPKIYQLTDSITHDDATNILNAKAPQLHLVVQIYSLLSIIDTIKLDSGLKMGSGKINSYVIKKESNGEPFAKELITSSFFNFSNQLWEDTLKNAESYFLTK